MPKPGPAPEPRPLAGVVTFAEGDFHALSPELARDPQYNDRRLETRRKLLTLGKEVANRAARSEAGPLALECRTSLHHPHAFNGMRVRRVWAYLTRPAAEKRRLRRVLGPELGKDLDAAYRNAYLCVAIEDACLEASLRIHSDAWFDGQNLANRLKREGTAEWRRLLNELAGWTLRLHDWKGEWRCGELSRERLDEYLAYYTPGEHHAVVERRWPAPAGAREPVLQPGVAEELVAAVLRLAPLYRFAAWSQDNDHLFER